MTTGKAGYQGQVPTIKIEPVKGSKLEFDLTKEDLLKILPTYTSEQRKYQKCWNLDDYRKFSPGEHLVQQFLDSSNWKPGNTLIDWGCGTGRAARELAEHELDVTAVDFAFNALDDDVMASVKEWDNFRFIEHDLTEKTDFSSEFGFCCDVLEHIPPEDIDKVLDTILDASKHVFFQISTTEDHFGNHPEIDDHLHLTIWPYFKWLQKFIDKRCVVHYSEDNHNTVIFYVTGWSDQPLKFNGGQVNTDNETIIKNMAENAKLGLRQVKPHEAQDVTVMLLAGGASLNDYTDEIIKNREDGMKLITTNGTYGWAIDKGMTPSLQLMIDARPFNARFLKPVVDDCQYVLASQCDPSAFEGLPHDRTLIWQVSLSDELFPHVKEHYGEMYEDWYPCPGGSTTTLRALCLLRMLGFHRIIVYGLDSCYLEDRPHHAYPQPENDPDKIVDITIGGGTAKAKTFKCSPWMAYQIKDFEQMVGRVLSDCELIVKGPGAIAYLIEANAESI